MKKVAASSAESMPRIYREQKKRAKKQGITLPSFDSVKCSLYTARKLKLKVKKTVYKEAAEVEIPATFEDFLLADYLNGDTRIIIFCTNAAKKKWKL